MVELDLLVIGGYYGEGRRRGLVSQFLVAVADSKKNEGMVTENEIIAFFMTDREFSYFFFEVESPVFFTLLDEWAADAVMTN